MDADPKIVHSGLIPGCGNFGYGDLVGFTEDVVDCLECLALWKAEGMPKYIVRSGESNAQFRARTRTDMSAPQASEKAATS